MPHTRLVSAIVAAGVIAAGVSAGTAWAGGPGGVIENVDDMSVAVGTGVFEDDLVGFVAYGDTNEEAATNVIAQCQAAGGMECTSDEQTNDDLCIVSAADPVTAVVSGGAGLTIPDALQNAIENATANNMPISAADAVVVISDCSWDE
ncbi:hypothetical protein NGTWS0302_22930 [Mycolicibacterium cyprinidarum]|uniref:DUF4189 domain-containing protein n=1 Tax=Mycolicibacterium cyprinidarum TaxID=2860311 RepID=A0ABQ4V5A1_9MYCO|nr:hypothetical protein NGTWS0302_22930 [Mycolicibacterium sp. NGTWS0302]GJF10606.1 hypothetical protein NGTWS1702_06600 [Mycolicibacterium sp. NGTWSNA01]